MPKCPIFKNKPSPNRLGIVPQCSGSARCCRSPSVFSDIFRREGFKRSLCILVTFILFLLDQLLYYCILPSSAMFRQIARRTASQLTQRPQPTTTFGRRYAHAPATFDWRDPLGAKNLYTDEELSIAETAESYCQERMLPRVLGMHRYPALCFENITNTIRGIPE